MGVPIEEDWLTKPNHVLTMFSGSLPMPMVWQVPIKVKP